MTHGARAWQRLSSHPVLSVFDISQTDADEGVAEPVEITHQLTGEDETEIFERTAAIMRARGWDVASVDIAREGLNGYTDPTTREIRVDEAGPRPEG